MHDAGTQQMTEQLRIVQVTAPTELPVTLGEAKLHARIDEDADNALVPGLVRTATELAESYSRRAIMRQTWKLNLDAWPTCGFVEMPKAPLVSVTHIKTYDDSDVATEFSGASYQVDAVTRPGRITVRSTASWPTPTRTMNGIEIQFVCGYATDPANVPAVIKNAILAMVAFLYENRGDAAAMIPDHIYAMLDGERTWLV
jgi:uncharacterized phiE125 gp8 family phage protein